MQFRTPVIIPHAKFEIQPCERMLFVGSCFADNIGQRFKEEKFRAIVNPLGVMYNPVSIGHTVARLFPSEGKEERATDVPQVVVFTLGTNHVYVLKETGEVVDNCEKRPQRLFEERTLTVAECVEALHEAIRLLQAHNPQVQVILTVSPIRYAKYGFPGSQRSKATLLLAAAQLAGELPNVHYFPAYEIMNDELRDYRFYAPDMLHPSAQAVEYIYERFADAYFSAATRQFIQEWTPIREALHHRPFHPESPEYLAFMAKTRARYKDLKARYPQMED